MDTYSDNNSAPPECPEQSAGSSVSSRFQDEYEELLKYAVVVPKIDVDDLPRVLADSKRHLTQSCRLPTPSEEIHTSSEEEDEGSVAAKPLPQIVPTKQGLGRILTPARKPSNKESDIETVTPKTRVSPSQQYHHKHG
ncbi:hypothetical protein EB796_012834 [Bugula neritina]|uniref:Uncharacterized protein n=1 Tax=Bugula neritina TaxID=10212 RepID=A0A7J7JR64_BUGNE|nr:hypothetical protein EB796_012834 [Bugula neritina]